MATERAAPARLPETEPDHDPGLLGAGLSSVRLALGVVDLSDLTIRAISDAGCALLGLPPDRVVGRPVADVIDPVDRPAILGALDLMRRGYLEFYRAHRNAVGPAAPKTGLCAWVRRMDLDGRPHAFVRWVDPQIPPGPWPTGVDVFAKAVAIAITDARGIVGTAALFPDRADDYSLDAFVGTRLPPSTQVGNLVTLADVRAARIRGVSIAFGVPVRTRTGTSVELEAIATAMAGSGGWLAVLVEMAPRASSREAELMGHLWRIAAEVEASGVLVRAGATPGLALMRIPEAASLTPRQWEVLQRLVAGQRVPTIAQQLYLSQSTVRNHLAAIFQAFGVHSQAELLAAVTRTDAPSIGTDGLPMA